MPIAGLRNTANWAPDQRPKHWRESVLKRMPNGNAPLLALTNLMKSEKVDDPEFYWWEKPIQSRLLRMNEDLDISETAITVLGSESSALLFKNGDVLRSPETGEYMLVTSVTDANTINVTRGFAGSIAAVNNCITTTTLNPYLVHVGSVFEENSQKPTAVGNEPVKFSNYTQIHRDNFGASRNAVKTRLRTENDVAEAKRECLEIHSMGIERALIWGRRWEGTINSQPARTTGGILSFIPASNVQAAGATTNMTQLEGYLERMFRFGSNEKIGFTGSLGLLVIQQIVRKNTSYQIFAREKEYGMNVARLVTPFGELVLKNHPLFNLERTAGATWSKQASSNLLVVDAANLRYRYFDDMMYMPKQENNGQDGMESGYLTDCGLEVHHGDTHFSLTGLTAAAAD